MSLYPNSIRSFLFIVLFANAFGQTATYPFEVRKSGQGKQALILIPGFACSGEVWKETLEKFEPEFTCYTLTMAGFAGTAPQPDATFHHWETSIAAYIRENNLNKPILVGHSMGGGLALAIASDYPDLIGKVVVVDALPCLAALMDPGFKSAENNDCSDMVKQVTSMSDEQFYQMQKMSMPRLMTDTSMQETVIRWSMQSDRKTFGEMFCDFSNTDLREKIKAVTCPSLILLESYFVHFKPTIEEQYKNLKTANLQYATKGLHFIMYDDKEWYLNQLKNFIISQP